MSTHPPVHLSQGAEPFSVGDEDERAVANPYVPVVIARAGGLRAVRPGLRPKRYRQGV